VDSSPGVFLLGCVKEVWGGGKYRGGQLNQGHIHTLPAHWLQYDQHNTWWTTRWCWSWVCSEANACDTAANEHAPPPPPHA
jgi:hypothetical protein